MRQVVLSKMAKRTLQRLPRNTASPIVSKIEQYACEPESLAANVAALRGSPGLRRLRVGDRRIMFTETHKVLTVQRIAARGEAYGGIIQ